MNAPISSPSFWDCAQSLANTVSGQRPSVGRIVTINKGKKHLGKTGIVLRHVVNRFNSPFRYCDSYQAAFKEMCGRSGYRILVKTETETFWVPANYALVHEETQS